MSDLATSAAARLLTIFRGLVLAAVLGLVALPAVAQSYSFSGVSVQGNQRIETQTILTYLGLSSGQTVSAAALNDAVQKVRETGLFETVDARLSGTTLIVTVVELPTISVISFEGNSKIKDDDLRSAIRSMPRHVFSPSQVERDVGAIVQLYADKGRISATITPRIIRRSDNRVDVVFEIFEGGVTEIARIGFVGNRSFSDYRLRGVLETKQAGLLRAIIGRDTFVADRIDFDKQVLSEFYRSRGYVDFEIQSVDVELTRERDAYLITFNVQEGQKYAFGEVKVTSDLPDVDLAEFDGVVRTRDGQIYSPLRIENDIARLEFRANQLGLQFVQADPQITRRDRELTLDLNYALVRGPRIFVERIDITGNTTTLDRVVRNQFTLVEGDPLNPRSIRESASRIRALGFFSTAEVGTRAGSSSEQVIVDVAVNEVPTGSLTFGANYNTDTGFSLIASYSERNFLGRGQALDFQISTAVTNQVLTFNFTEPYLLGRNLRLGLRSGYKTTDNEAALYDTTSFGFSPSLSFPVSENGRLGISYSIDYSLLSNVTTTTPAIVDDAAAGGRWTNSVGYTYTWDNRRTGLDPNAGVLLRFGQEYAFGEATFLKNTATLAAETKIMNEEVTLRATLEGGYLYFLEGSSRITDRYFMNSSIMRGFESGGFGPRYNDGTENDALGGNTYAVVRLESEFPIGLPTEFGMHGGAFLDYGSLWDTGLSDLTDVLYNDFTPRAVVGLSLFWQTPIGPLRFNFMQPLISETYDRPKSFDLTIATSF
jgi:outer membrane protein insertion porin family